MFIIYNQKNTRVKTSVKKYQAKLVVVSKKIFLSKKFCKQQ